MYIYVYDVTHANASPNKTDIYLFAHSHIHTGMWATKLRVKHMEDRLFIHRNYCLQDMNGKFGLDHLTSLKGIKARLHLGQLMEYQK